MRCVLVRDVVVKLMEKLEGSKRLFQTVYGKLMRSDVSWSERRFLNEKEQKMSCVRPYVSA